MDTVADQKVGLLVSNSQSSGSAQMLACLSLSAGVHRFDSWFHLRNRSALAVNCVLIHCLEVSCKEDQITSAQRE